MCSAHIVANSKRERRADVLRANQSARYLHKSTWLTNDVWSTPTRRHADTPTQRRARVRAQPSRCLNFSSISFDQWSYDYFQRFKWIKRQSVRRERARSRSHSRRVSHTFSIFVFSIRESDRCADCAFCCFGLFHFPRIPVCTGLRAYRPCVLGIIDCCMFSNRLSCINMINV